MRLLCEQHASAGLDRRTGSGIVFRGVQSVSLWGIALHSLRKIFAPAISGAHARRPFLCTHPPSDLVLSLLGLPAVVVASRVAGVRTILMQVVAPRADAVRFSAFWVRAPQDTPSPPRISLVLSLSGLPAVANSQPEK